MVARRPDLPDAARLPGARSRASRRRRTGRKARMWLTLAVPDYVEMLTWKYFTKLARDLLLSIITLANNDPSATPHAPEPAASSTPSATSITLGLAQPVPARVQAQELGPDEGRVEPLAAARADLPLVAPARDRSRRSSAGSSARCSARRSRATRTPSDQGQDVVVDPAVHAHDGLLALPPAGGLDAGRHVHAVHRHSAYVGYQPKSTSPYKMPFDPAAVTTLLHRAGKPGPLQPQLQQRRPGLRVRLQPRRGRRDPRRALRHGDRVLRERPERPTTRPGAGPRRKLATPIGAGAHPDDDRRRSTAPSSPTSAGSCSGSATATSPTTRR